MQELANDAWSTWQAWLAGYKGDPVRAWMIQHTDVPVVISAAYLLLVLYVPKYVMQKREAYNLRTVNILWNAALTIFSCAGAYYCLPLVYTSYFADTYETPLPDHTGVEVRRGGVYTSVCNWTPTLFFEGPVGAFVGAFILSKIPEMFDTVLLVLQKKPVIFLHWYHHITVMLYCWHAYIYHIASGLTFAGINFGVHSIMYAYYFFCSIGMRRYVRPIAPLITFLQIAQMLVGLFIQSYSMYHLYISGKRCDANPTNVRFGILMYTSYLVLFCKLFKDSYLTPRPKRNNTSVRTSTVEAKDAPSPRNSASSVPAVRSSNGSTNRNGNNNNNNNGKAVANGNAKKSA